MTEKDKMLAGQLYHAGDAELIADHRAARRWSERYNAATADPDRLAALLPELLGAVGQGVVIRPPFHIDYGYNLFVGDGVFMNFGCVVLDVMPVRIGAGTQVGPGVQFLAADHPRDPAVRASGLESGKPVTVGRNAWIGAGALILPGVTIGDDALVGAGSVVTRDVPAGATVVGNPARLR